MRDSRIVYLEVTSWRGISIGASHWYGELVCPEPYTSVELKRRLTYKSAAKLNEDRNDYYAYRSGQEFNGFDSEKDVRLFAIRVYKKHFPKAKILLLGASSSLAPHLVLDGGNNVFRKMSRAAIKRCEKLGWYEGGHEDAVDEICDNWNESLKKLLSQEAKNG